GRGRLGRAGACRGRARAGRDPAVGLSWCHRKLGANDMIAIAGGLLAALGILAGALLGAAAFGLAAAGPSLWILFPLLTLVGWFLLVVSDVDPLRGTPTRVVASALLLLALLAAVGLVGGGAGLLAIQGSGGTFALC